MNASSGIYNINGYNILCNNTTILSTLNVKGVDVSNYINNNNTNLSNINTNLNNLSTNTTLNISNLNNTSTTIFTNLNNLSTNSTLNISNLNATSTTLLGYINALTNPSTLKVNNLNVSQTSVLNGASTCISTLNVSGTTLLKNNTTISSSLNVAGVTKIGSGNVADEFTVFDVQGNIVLKKNYIFGGTNYGDTVYIAAANSATTTQSSIYVKSTGIDIEVLNTSGELFINAYTRILKNLNVQGSIYCQNVMRKQTFNFICETPIIINGTTYYRYDIDLNRYTAYYTRTSGATTLGTQRKFKWMSWLTSGVHETGHDLNYDISCSYKYLSPLIGLSICAYGYPFESKLLNSVNPNPSGPFLLRNSFDYITYCCSIQNSLITAMIIDYL